MKKILFLLLLIPIFLFSAYTTDNVENQKYRLESIDKYIQKEKQTLLMVENYLFLTGDTDITNENIINFFSLNKNFFKGISSNYTFTLDNGTLIISNSLTNNNTITDKILNYYLKNKDNSYVSNIKDNKVYINLPDNVLKVYDFLIDIKDSDTFVVINNSTNLDSISKTKKTLIYDGNGFKISKYNTDTNSWEVLGYYDFYNKKGILVNSEEDLTAIGGLKNTKAYVLSEDGSVEMRYSNGSWKQISTGSGNYFVGDGTIYEAACKIYNYDGGSELIVNPDKDEYLDTIEIFTKVDESDNNGYWISSDGYYLIIKEIADTKYLTYTGNTNVSSIFICSTDAESYYSLKKLNLNGSSTWVIQLSTMDDLLHFTGSSFSDTWFYVTETGLYLKKVDNLFYTYYKSINNNLISFTDYIIGSGSREVFDDITLEDDKTYLTTLSDCSTKNNCSGTTTKEFGGETYYGLYKWTNINGELQDVIKSTLTNAYTNEYSYFYNTVNSTYYKKVYDNNNNNFCYLNLSNNKYYMANNNELSSFFINDSDNSLNFPDSDINCANNLNNQYLYGTYTKYDNTTYNGYIILIDDLETLANWEPSQEINSLVVIDNVNYLFTYVNNQWQNLNIVVANGSRTDLTYYDNGITKVYYTTELGSGDFYNNGYFDTNYNLYQWRYEPNADKQLNGFIDIYKVSDIATAYNNLSRIYKETIINNELFYKKTYNTSYGTTITCLEDENGNIYSKNYGKISSIYYYNEVLQFPTDYTCTNLILNDNDYIKINSLSDLNNQYFSNNIYFIFNDDYKLKYLYTNQYIISDDTKYLVLGNRSNFNYNIYTSDTNYLNYDIYTTIDDSSENENYIVLGNQTFYLWQYYLNSTGSINGLIKEFKPTNCQEIYNVISTDYGTYEIYDNNNEERNVTCSNGNMILKLGDYKDNINITVLNSDSSESNYIYDEDEFTIKFLYNTNNILKMNIDLPFTFSSFKLVNQLSEDHSIEGQYNDNYNVVKYLSSDSSYTDLLDYINNYYSFLDNKSDTSKTNYIALSLVDNNNNEIDKISDLTNSFTATFFYYDNINFIFMFNNKDNTDNLFYFNSNLEIVLKP